MSIIRSIFKLEWQGEWKPEMEADPNNWWFTILQQTGESWEELGTFPTLIPLDADEDVTQKALRQIMDEIHSPLKKGEDITELLEKLSWIAPDWLEEDDVLSLHS